MASIRLFAAGSLRDALSAVAKAYEAASGQKVEAKFGPSGLLAADIASGTPADAFASANMAHPQALHDAGLSGPATCFARNTLCALARPGLPVTSASLLDTMLDPKVKLATSTPKSDPAGDYAWEVFRKAEALKSGAYAALDRKALQLTGDSTAPPPEPGRIIYGQLVANGQADIFLTYATNAVAAVKQNPGQQIVDLPRALAVGADYGLAVMTDASPAAQRLAEYIRSAEAQAVLAKFGFAPPNQDWCVDACEHVSL